MRIRMLSYAAAAMAIAAGSISLDTKGTDWDVKHRGGSRPRPHCVNSGVASARRAARKRRNVAARSSKCRQ